ncbi:MAG: lamin tail domain-containing protein [Acidobacteriia bacterium]|nr:lamin tail domain-containing protein [Terriglobia bacterium]
MKIPRLSVLASLAVTFTILLCASSSAFADYTVRGTFSYEDRDFNLYGFTNVKHTRPIRYADVEVWAAGKSLAAGATDQNGNYSITVPGSTAQAISVRCYATAPATSGFLLDVRRNSNQHTNFSDPNGAIWYIETGQIPYAGTPTLDAGTVTAPSTNEGNAFNVWDVIIDGLEFVNALTGGFPADKLTAVWSSAYSKYSSYYAGPSSVPTLTKKYFFLASAYDDAVIYHQFGHFVADTYSKLDGPAISADGFLPIFGDGDQDMRMAWAEGVAMFIGASIRQFKGYAQPEAYVVTDGTNAVRSFEILSLTAPPYALPLVNPALASTSGSTNMLAVASALWNVTSGPVLQRPFSDVWRALTAMKSITSPGITTDKFWDTWFSPAVGNGNLSEMQAVFGARGIEFFADAQEPDDSPANAPAISTAQLQPASGPKVVINEILVAGVNAIELFNAGDTTADLTGWTVATVASAPTGSLVNVLDMPVCQLKAGGFVLLIEASGTSSSSVIYFNSKFPWISGADGACDLRDSTGAGKDFVRWGSSRYIGTSGFTGTNPPSPVLGKTIGRDFNGTDTNSGDDWKEQLPSLGTFNLTGLEMHHTLYPAGDMDYTAFNATAGRLYAIETVNLTNGADTVLDIIAPDGTTVLATGDDYGPTSASRILWTASSSGRYYVLCRRYQGSSNLAEYGSYDLRILESASPLGIPGPDILTVSKPGLGGRYQTIGDAVDAAGNGDTIQIIDSGRYLENLIITGKSITLKVAGGQNPILDGRSGSGPALALVSLKNVRIDSLTIVGGTQGIWIWNGNAMIVNTIVSRATDSKLGDGVEVVGTGTNATLVNCTVVYNTRLGLGVFSNATVRISNSILRDNKGGADVGGDTTATASTIYVTNSLVGKQQTGLDIIDRRGNISVDPKFVDPANDDFHLQSSSPVIDKGDSLDQDLPATDAWGAPRAMDGGTGLGARPDMGAFEYCSLSSLGSLAVFPQIAVGGNPEYRTSVIAVNPGSQPVVVNVALIQNGSEPLRVSASGKVDSSFPIVISPGGTTRLETSIPYPGDTLQGYARLLSNLPLNGSALFKLMSGNSVVSEAGVGLSKPTRSFTIYIDNLNDAYSGYAIANYGTAVAHLTLTLRDKFGNVIQPSQPAASSLALFAGQHIAEFAFQRFANEAGAGFEGSIEFAGDQNVSAVALRYDNWSTAPVFSTIPVLVDEMATTLYFPQAADGAGYHTNFILVNPGTIDTTARLEFFDNDGKPMQLSIEGGSRTSYDVPVLKAKGVFRLITQGASSPISVGWVKVTSQQPIGGSAIFQNIPASLIASEAGVASSPLASHFAAYVSSIGDAQSGLAICNPNDNQVSITLKLRDTAGNVVATRQFSLLPKGHVATFFSGQNQWFPTGFDEFEGTLEVVATGGQVSAVALRYDNVGGTVFATLPVTIIQ